MAFPKAARLGAALAACVFAASPGKADLSDLSSLSGIGNIASQALQISLKAEGYETGSAVLGLGLSLLMGSGSSSPDAAIQAALIQIESQITALQTRLNTLQTTLDRDIAAVLTREFYNSILAPQSTINAQLAEYLNILSDPVAKDKRIKALVDAILDVNNGTQTQLYAIDAALTLSMSQLLLAPVASPAATWDEAEYFASAQFLQSIETYRFLGTVLLAEARNARANDANATAGGDPQGVTDAVSYFYFGDTIQPGGLKQHIIDVGIPISGNGYTAMFARSDNRRRHQDLFVTNQASLFDPTSQSVNWDTFGHPMVGDFNSDGVADLALLNPNGKGDIFVQYGAFVDGTYGYDGSMQTQLYLFTPDWYGFNELPTSGPRSVTAITGIFFTK